MSAVLSLSRTRWSPFSFGLMQNGGTKNLKNRKLHIAERVREKYVEVLIEEGKSLVTESKTAFSLRMTTIKYWQNITYPNMGPDIMLTSRAMRSRKKAVMGTASRVQYSSAAPAVLM